MNLLDLARSALSELPSVAADVTPALDPTAQQRAARALAMLDADLSRRIAVVAEPGNPAHVTVAVRGVGAAVGRVGSTGIGANPSRQARIAGRLFWRVPVREAGRTLRLGRVTAGDQPTRGGRRGCKCGWRETVGGGGGWHRPVGRCRCLQQWRLSSRAPRRHALPHR